MSTPEGNRTCHECQFEASAILTYGPLGLVCTSRGPVCHSRDNITENNVQLHYCFHFTTKVLDLILRPPAEVPYDRLKGQLIKRTAVSEQRRLQQLFSSEELGDHKPTQLSQQMQQLLSNMPGMPDGSFI